MTGNRETDLVRMGKESVKRGRGDGEEGPRCNMHCAKSHNEGTYDVSQLYTYKNFNK